MNFLHNTPIPEDQSIYPYNSVTQSRSGHVFEVDDTMGHERIKETHKSGTYREVNASGGVTTVILGEADVTIHKPASLTVFGHLNVFAKSASLTVTDDYKIEVNGNMEQTVKGQYKLKVGSYINEVTGDKEENIKGKKGTTIGTGLVTTVKSGGKMCSVIGDVTNTNTGGHSTTCTGFNSTVGVLGNSVVSPAGVNLTGGIVGIDSATLCNITSLGATNMLSSVTTMATPLLNVVSGGILSTGDIRALGGVRGLVTHVHAVGGSASPATGPPIAG